METRAWERAEGIEPLMRFVDLLQMAAGMVDQGGSVRYANTTWTEISGGTSPEISDLVASEERAHLAELVSSLSSRPPTGPTDVRLANGRWAQLQIQTLDGFQDGWWLCTATDIHDLRSHHDALEINSVLQATLLDASQDCIKLLDVEGRIRYMNDAGCRALGVSARDGFGQRWVDLMPETVQPLGESSLARACAGEIVRFTGHTCAEGTVIEWDNLLTPSFDADGGVSSILCVARNVTEERAAQQALSDSRERLAMASLVGGLGIWDFDLATDRLICDATWHAIMGLPPGTVTSMEEFAPRIHPDDLAHATEVQHTAAHLIETGEDYTNTFRIIRPTGEIRWVRSAACLILDDHDEPVRAIGFIIDHTDSLRGQQALEEENRTLQQEREVLSQQSSEDDLTGLANRRMLIAELAHLARFRAASDAAASVVMLDIDHFKAFNDRDGHLAGDAALVRVGHVLREALGPRDLAARYGGDEFVVVLPTTADPEPFLTRVFDLLLAAEIPASASTLGRLTISCGAAVLPPRTDASVEQMLRAADRAMYAAKARGRNGYVVDWEPVLGLGDALTDEAG